MYERTLNALIRRRVAELGLAALGLTGHKIPGATTGTRKTPGGAGYPDWTICGPGGVLFRECKSADGRRSMAQVRWGRELERAGADYAVWRPEDWESGRIDRELTRLAAGRAR